MISLYLSDDGLVTLYDNMVGKAPESPQHMGKVLCHISSGVKASTSVSVLYSVLLQTLKTQRKALVIAHKIRSSPALLHLEGHLELHS